MTRKNNEGIIIEDFNSMEEGLNLVERSDFPPTEKEVSEDLPYVHGNYDFSNILGERFYENRKVRYLFYKKFVDYPRRKIDKMAIQNKLANKFNVRILDTAKPGYHYFGKVSRVDIEDVHIKHRLEISIELDCYPFLISNLPEGNDIWDTFNFELDVAQQTDFHIKRPAQDGSSFRPLKVGDEATIGAWATQYGEHEGERNPIFQSELGLTSIITGTTSNDTSISNRAYYLEGFEAPIVEQDILQAYTTGVDITLINPGTPSVAPEVTVDAKVSLVKDNTVYNFYGGTFENTLFRLEPGENHIKVFSILERDISFDFRKELI